LDIDPPPRTQCSATIQLGRCSARKGRGLENQPHTLGTHLASRICYAIGTTPLSDRALRSRGWSPSRTSAYGPCKHYYQMLLSPSVMRKPGSNCSGTWNELTHFQCCVAHLVPPLVNLAPDGSDSSRYSIDSTSESTMASGLEMLLKPHFISGNRSLKVL
jgi:hypothetical protein